MIVAAVDLVEPVDFVDLVEPVEPAEIVETLAHLSEYFQVKDPLSVQESR